MSKKLIISVSIILLNLLIFVSIVMHYGNFRNVDSLMGRLSNFLNRNNQIDLVLDGIAHEEVEVFWTCYTRDVKVFSDGSEDKKIGHEYGRNNFRILLHNGLEFEIGHFKHNDWYAHDYIIELIRIPDGYILNFIADGPDYQSTSFTYNDQGVLHGLYCEYNEDGLYVFRGFYEHGNKNGRFVYCYPNGAIKSVMDYSNDLLHGTRMEMDEYGDLIREEEYSNGVLLRSNN